MNDKLLKKLILEIIQESLMGSDQGNLKKILFTRLETMNGSAGSYDGKWKKGRDKKGVEVFYYDDGEGGESCTAKIKFTDPTEPSVTGSKDGIHSKYGPEHNSEVTDEREFPLESVEDIEDIVKFIEKLTELEADYEEDEEDTDDEDDLDDED